MSLCLTTARYKEQFNEDYFHYVPYGSFGLSCSVFLVHYVKDCSPCAGGL